MSNQSKLSPLAAHLCSRIKDEGSLPFSEYMAECLYHPEYGYYKSSGSRIGKYGDFFTSSSVHALFGRLIARQLIQMAQILGDKSFQVVEQGPGEGHLALDVLDTISAEAPEVYDRLSYTLLELNPQNKTRQARRLQAHANRINWCDKQSWSISSGCFLSNELVDAFPVEIIEKQHEAFSQVYISCNQEKQFVEEFRTADPKILDYFKWLGVSPEKGNRAEVNLAAPRWMREVGSMIQKGFVITIDYGYPSEELYAPHRRGGTLMCYHRHQADDNPYERPGEKDITAHFDFSALMKAGKEVGLSPSWFGEQYRFLLGLGFIEELIRLQAQITDEQEAMALRMTLKNLIMPDTGMGETFKVLVQQKNVAQCKLLCDRPIRDVSMTHFQF
ncbi:MAG: SAM-dependent methyltransferase [Deltaproteobacteria bacterium]|jgi:SAM-dependent MidA family methyltransferase|nr:SAM-dependent methyltransferase [Deltaproteobacteria bacterium]